MNNPDTITTRAVNANDSSILRESGKNPYWISKNLTDKIGCCMPYSLPNKFYLGCGDLPCSTCPFALNERKGKTLEKLITFLKTENDKKR